MFELLPTKYRRWVLAIAVTVPLLLLLAMGMLAHRTVRHAQETNDSVRRIIRLKEASAQLLTVMLDNEAGQRGYILSQMPIFLEPYDYSLVALPHLRATLEKGLTGLEARVALTELNRAVEARLLFAARTVQMVRDGRPEESVALIQTGQGKVLMDEVRRREGLLETHLDSWARAEEARYVTLAGRNEVISWVVLVMDLIVAALLFGIMRRMRRNSSLLRVCAWSKTVDYQGEWVTFEEYLQRRFGVNVSHGISPAEMERVLAEAKGLRSAELSARGH